MCYYLLGDTMKNVIDFILNNTIIFEIISRAAIVVALNLACRARNIAARRKYTILAIFFPLIMCIIYLIRRKGEKIEKKQCASCGNIEPMGRNQCSKCGGFTLVEYKNPKAKMLKTIAIVLIIVGLLAEGVQFAGVPAQVKEMMNIAQGIEDGEDVIDPFEEWDDETVCYDKNANAYSSRYDVVYYDKDGGQYTVEYEEEYYVADENGNKYAICNCYIDKDGCFVYDENATENNVFMDEFLDKNGEICYKLVAVTWDYTGQMLVNGETLE